MKYSIAVLALLNLDDSQAVNLMKHHHHKHHKHHDANNIQLADENKT